METSDEVTVPVSVLRTVADILRDQRGPILTHEALEALAGRLEALLPQPPSLHEVVFWEIRSGPSRDEREWADWIMRLCTERVTALRWWRNTDQMTMDGIPEALNRQDVLDLFAVPEGRDTESVVSEVEAAMVEALRRSPSSPKSPAPALAEDWASKVEITETSCPAHDGHRWCRRTRGHVGYHVDTQGNSFGMGA